MSSNTNSRDDADEVNSEDEELRKSTEKDLGGTRGRWTHVAGPESPDGLGTEEIRPGFFRALWKTDYHNTWPVEVKFGSGRNRGRVKAIAVLGRIFVLRHTSEACEAYEFSEELPIRKGVATEVADAIEAGNYEQPVPVSVDSPWGVRAICDAIQQKGQRPLDITGNDC